MPPSKKRGEIAEVERGKYAVVDNPFSVASNIVFPSYISFVSGLAYYGFTTQISRTITVASPKQKNGISVDGYRIRFVRLAKKRFFGYLKEKSQGKSVFVAEPEKLLLDCVLLPQYCPLTEVFEAIEMLSREKKMDSGKIIAYCKRMGSSVVAKRIGYLMGLAGNDIYGGISEMINKKYDRLNPLLKKGKGRNKKWKLIINEDVA